MNIHLMFSASFFLIFLCGELQKTEDLSSHIFFFSELFLEEERTGIGVAITGVLGHL